MTENRPYVSKTFFVRTFGCQMNVADSERMEALLSDAGLTRADDATQADVIVINGCSVREKAVHKAVSALGVYQKMKAKNPEAGPILAVGGCVAQLEQGDLFRRAPYLDFVFGPDNIDDLPEMLYQVERGRRHILKAEFDDRKERYSTETKIYEHKAQAFVNIMKGCDKFCTYCIVPFTRGREKSRTISEVVEDVAALVSRGVREITLLGQNVNSFGKGTESIEAREPRELSNRIGKVGPKEGEENFPQLLYALDQDPRCAELRRIRFTSSHPLDFSDQLIDCYDRSSPKGVRRLAAQLHLPVQSGSNEVLRRMGRHHKIEDYIAQMDRLREINPDVGLSTDLIVGFPGETEAQFEETLALLDRVQYDQIFAFAYSVRPGTRAAKLEDDVSAEDKKRRLNTLIQHQLSISEVRNRNKIGTVMEVMVEGRAKNELMKGFDGTSQSSVCWTGRTECGRLVHFLVEHGRNLSGALIPVRIETSSSLSLYGTSVLDSGLAERLTGEREAGVLLS